VSTPQSDHLLVVEYSKGNEFEVLPPEEITVDDTVENEIENGKEEENEVEREYHVSCLRLSGKCA
jgi:hypothetical protein